MKNYVELELLSETTECKPVFFFFLPHTALHRQDWGGPLQSRSCFHCCFCFVLFCWVFPKRDFELLHQTLTSYSLLSPHTYLTGKEGPATQGRDSQQARGRGGGGLLVGLAFWSGVWCPRMHKSMLERQLKIKIKFTLLERSGRSNLTGKKTSWSGAKS